jgi:hypothetical protein
VPPWFRTGRRACLLLTAVTLVAGAGPLPVPVSLPELAALRHGAAGQDGRTVPGEAPEYESARTGARVDSAG